MIKIKNLKARVVDGPEILSGVNLEVKAGENHAIMGPNGSGKSTLSRVISGHPDYEITAGSVVYERNGIEVDLLELSAAERACEGVFLAFQYPVEVPGVSNAIFLRASYNAIRRYREETELDPIDFAALLKEKALFMGIDESFIDRPVNVDFSGGEKKRNEILQMAVLQPQLAILDETDSGLDVDSLREISAGVNSITTADTANIIITHYQRLLDYIKPDIVHIFLNGKIVKSGGPELALEVEKRGYDWVKES